MSSRKRYRPRPVAVNTFAIALSGATKPAKRDVDEILCVLNAAFKALREGVATETQWAILDACLMEAMEADGVVTPMDCSGVRQVIICPGPGDSFAIGQTVRITSDDNKLGLIARKHGGKTGTITRREEGGGYWDVTFKGRGGGVAMFAEDQMEAVQA